MLDHAPAPRLVGELLAVPIHIRQLSAAVSLDAGAGRGHVDAVMSYQVGPTSGCPLFDLRQTVDHAWLDGRPITTARLASHHVGEGHDATVRVLDVAQAAGSTHTLRLSYRLGQPTCDMGGAYPPVLSAPTPGRLRWSFGMGDLFDGRHLEMWLPSNLPFDQFPFELTLGLSEVATDHTLITNGTSTRTGPHSWHVMFPAWFSSVSALVELRPTDELDHLRVQAVLERPVRKVPVDVWKVKSRPEDLPQEAARIARMLRLGEAMFGPFPSGRYTCFFHGAEGGMEYGGATTTSAPALGHEVLHSWFARGVLPATDADGWWDEGFTTYITEGAAPAPLDFVRPPVELCSRRPFQRHTDGAAYVEGSRLFSGLAEMAGRSSLLHAMRCLFLSRRRTPLSTVELEQHLVCATGAIRIVDAFHRFVYGFDDPRRRSGVRVDRLWLSDGPDGRPWISAQVSNAPDAEPCRHFLLLFTIGTQGDGLPGPDVAAVAGFDLQPGRARVLRVRVAERAIDRRERVAAVDVVGAVHVRLAHPSGEPSDYREGTMVRTRISVPAPRAPEPGTWSWGW